MLYKIYRLSSGARIYTGPVPSVVPAWAPTQFSVSLTRSAAAKALWERRRLVTSITKGFA